jgi:pilus assembly protein Flp/PilA
MLKTIQQLSNDESGATALEYGLIAALVSVAAIGALTQLGGSLNNIFGIVSGRLDAAADAASAAASTPSPAP